MSNQIYLLRQYTSKLGRVFQPKEFYAPEEFDEEILADLIRLNYAMPLESGVKAVKIQEVEEKPRRKYKTREMRGVV
jgi:hypothetical protein